MCPPHPPSPLAAASLRPPPLHSSWRQRQQLSSASLPKFALTLGITDPYLVLCCLKRLNTAHSVRDTFIPPCVRTHTHVQSRTVLEQTLAFKPPTPPSSHLRRRHPITKRKHWRSSECQQARVCLTFAKCHGILGSLHQQEAPWNPGGRGPAYREHCVPPGGTLTRTLTHLWTAAAVCEPELDGALVGGSRPARCCHASLWGSESTAVR